LIQTLDEKLLSLRKAIRLNRSQKALVDNISGNLRYYRQKRGLSQKAVAELLDIKQPTYNRMESSDYKDYQVSTLNRLALALDVGVVSLVVKRRAGRRVDKNE
jgi:transcriptional regulator with XRE-family HTH domain